MSFTMHRYKGSGSRWYGYLCSLPEDCVQIATFWGVDGDRDGVEALNWLQGTEAWKLLFPPKGRKFIVGFVIRISVRR
jgi:hypothetical protein